MAKMSGEPHLVTFLINRGFSIKLENDELEFHTRCQHGFSFFSVRLVHAIHSLHEKVVWAAISDVVGRPTKTKTRSPEIKIELRHRVRFCTHLRVYTINIIPS